MKRTLIIVESPAKVKTISKFLPKSYEVKSSLGHVRDLPVRAKFSVASLPKDTPAEEKARLRQVAVMGIDPSHQWKAKYEILPGKERTIKELKQSAKDVDTIILATDLDREGEAIAWHLQCILGKNYAYQRIVFNSITEKAIKDALKNPKQIDMNLVNAQQARRFLDRFVGYSISPLLWKFIGRGLSAGRVQSIALLLVSEREKTIRNFVPKEYWDIQAHLKQNKKDENAVLFNLTKYKKKNVVIENKKSALLHQAALKKSDFIIENIENKDATIKTPPPFITSTLQQVASTKLGFSIKKTMVLAQKLYEQGLITYMRTDTFWINPDSVEAVRDVIQKRFGKEYIPEKPNFYGKKAHSQEAHEAIRPSQIDLAPHQFKTQDDSTRLYQLIYNQFLASQMSPAKIERQSITVKAGDFELKAKGDLMRFDGFTRLLNYRSDNALPKMTLGQTLHADQIIPSQHFTRPSPRYTEASLVSELEKQGIGRPSTYVPTIMTLQDREYISVQKKRIYVNKIGEIVNAWLMLDFNDLMRFEFTAEMEEKLDTVAQGSLNWIKLLDDFHKPFAKTLQTVNQQTTSKVSKSIDSDIPCPKCKRPMCIQFGINGVFLGCSGYYNTDNTCKTTINLTPAPESFIHERYRKSNHLDSMPEDQDDLDLAILIGSHRCKKCESLMLPYFLDDFKTLIEICGNMPVCDYHTHEKGNFLDYQPTSMSIECHRCEGIMTAQKGPFGPYFKCEQCDAKRKALPDGTPAPVYMDPIPMPELECTKFKDHFLLRESANGLFLAAKLYPKHRESRSPKLSELVPHKDEFPEYLHFIFDLPEQDPDGNPVILSFSKKAKTYMAISEAKKKRTKWRKIYQDGQWIDD